MNAAMAATYTVDVSFLHQGQEILWLGNRIVKQPPAVHSELGLFAIRHCWHGTNSIQYVIYSTPLETFPFLTGEGEVR